MEKFRVEVKFYDESVIEKEFDHSVEGVIAFNKWLNSLDDVYEWESDIDSFLLNNWRPLSEFVDAKSFKGCKAMKIAAYDNNFEWVEKKLLNPSVEEIEEAIDGLYYEPGYGFQSVEGVVLFDSEWWTVEEYDGDEYWALHKMPSIEEVIGGAK